MTETFVIEYLGLPEGSPERELLEHRFGRCNIRKLVAKYEEERANKPPLEQWDCPICGHPQTAEEKSFNEHIDGCLSRQTIKEIVQTADESPASRLSSPAPASGSKKRGRPRGGGHGQSQAEPKKPKKAFFA